MTDPQHTCPNGHHNPPDVQFCTECGAPLSAATAMGGTIGWQEFIARLMDWWKHNLPRTLIFSAVSFGAGWLLNVYIISFRYDGFDKGTPGQAVATSSGNFWTGTLFWSVASMVVFAIAGYGFQVGFRKMFSDLAALPMALGSVFTRSGTSAWSLLLWSAALAMLVSGLVAPAVAGVLGVGLLLAAPSALSGLLGRFLAASWSSLIGILAPNQKARPPGLTGSVIATLGAGAGMAIAFLDLATGLQVGLAATAGVAAYVIATGRIPGRAATLLLLLAVVAAARMIDTLPAWADDGGWSEYGGSFGGWLGWDATHKVMGLSISGGVASAVGAFVGSAIGSIAGLLPPIQLDGLVTGTVPPPPPGTTPPDVEPEVPEQQSTEPLPPPPSEADSPPEEVSSVIGNLAAIVSAWNGLPVTTGTAGIDYEGAADWLSLNGATIGELAQGEETQQWGSLFGVLTDPGALKSAVDGLGNIKGFGGVAGWLKAGGGKLVQGIDDIGAGFLQTFVSNNHAALDAYKNQVGARKGFLDFIKKTARIGPGGAVDYIDDAGNSVLNAKVNMQKGWLDKLNIFKGKKADALTAAKNLKTWKGVGKIFSVTGKALGHTFNALNFAGDTYANTQSTTYTGDDGKQVNVEGDDLLTAAGKGGLTTYVSIKIVEKNPALAVAQLGSDLLLGQGEGGKIVGPMNNIKGAVNAVADFVRYGADTDKMYDRLKSGAYGDAYKHIAGGVEEAAEYLKDPKLLAEVLDNKGLSSGMAGETDSLGDLMDGMHQRVDEVFPDNPESWRITQAGNAAARTVSKGWLNLTEMGARGATSTWSGIKGFFGG